MMYMIEKFAILDTIIYLNCLSLHRLYYKGYKIYEFKTNFSNLWFFIDLLYQLNDDPLKTNNTWIVSSQPNNSTQKLYSSIGAIFAAVVVGLSAALSSWNPSSPPHGLWMALNQFQLILLLLLANSGIPYKIFDFLTGMKDTTCSFNFIPFKDIPGINTMIQKLDFPLNNNNLKPFGLVSGSTFVNNFSFIWIVVILIAIEGIFLIIYFIWKPKTSLESKSRKILTQLYQLFFISIYIRLIMETSQFIVICAVNDIYSSQTSDFKLLFSFITSIFFLLLALFLILVGFIEWWRFKNGFDDNHHIYFKEYFNGIRNNSVVRIYTALVLTRRLLIVTFLITWSSLSSIYLMQIVAIIQFIYLLGIIVLRPFQEIRNNWIEIVNEVYFFVMVIYISNYSTSDRWTDTAVDIFLYLILTNSLIIIVILLSNSFY